MAQDTNLGIAPARASDSASDDDSTRARFQRHMAETREAMEETYSDAKRAVADRYQTLRTAADDVLDWREQTRKHPVAVTIGAVGVGMVAGYALGAMIGAGEEDYRVAHEGDEQSRRDANALRTTGAFSDHHSYASHPITGSAQETSHDAADESALPPPPWTAPVREREASGDGVPGLFDRFKTSPVYDRVQAEVVDVGNRLMDEVSGTVRTVVVPALINKLRDFLVALLTPKTSEPGASPSLRSASTTPRPEAPSATRDTRPAAGATTEAPIAAAKAPDKFERLGDHQKATTADAKLTNASYDDRYERESRSFGKGEHRGFTAPPLGEKKD